MASNSNLLVPVAFAELQNGDQIAFKRKVELEKFNPAFKVLNPIAGDYYFHHGIFVEPNSIIHQTWENVNSAKPCKEDIWVLKNAISIDGTFYKVQYEEGSALPAGEVVMKAEEMVASGETQPFHIVTNNCETVATFMKTGKRHSSQVQAVGNKIKAASPQLYAFISGLFVGEFE